MNIIGWIVLGGLAGWVASLITGTSKNQNIFADIVLGIVGALIGGWVVDILGGDGITGFNIWSFVVALGGAIVVVWVYHAIAGTKRKNSGQKTVKYVCGWCAKLLVGAAPSTNMEQP